MQKTVNTVITKYKTKSDIVLAETLVYSYLMNALMMKALFYNFLTPGLTRE